MDNKDITIVIVAIAALVVGVVIGSQFAPQFSPTDDDPSDQPFINANECTRDGACEVNAISTYNPSRTVNIENANLTVNYGYGGIRAGSMTVYNSIKSFSVETVSLTTNSITAPSLPASSGNDTIAYVCIDRQGNFRKKTTPCI